MVDYFAVTADAFVRCNQLTNVENYPSISSTTANIFTWLEIQRYLLLFLSRLRILLFAA